MSNVMSLSIEKGMSSADNNFNLARLFLASSVIYFHGFGLVAQKGVSDPVQRAFFPNGLTIGGTAVDLFFLISGMFVAQSYFRDRNIFKFAIKRVMRIFPGLFVCIAATALIAVLIEYPEQIGGYLMLPTFWDYVLGNSTLHLQWEIDGIFQNHTLAAINGSIHTLPTEAKMYACLALTIGFFGRRSLALLYGALGFLVMLLFFPAVAPWLQMPLQGQMPSICFFAGVVVFAVARHLVINLPIVIAAITLNAMAPPQIEHATFIFAASCLVLWVSCLPKMGKTEADLSYGVYIYGWPSQQFLLSLYPGWDPYTHFAASMALALGFAALSWRFVEQPSIDFGKAASRAFGKRHGIVSLGRKFIAAPGLATVALLASAYVAFAGIRFVAEKADWPPSAHLDLGKVAYGPETVELGTRFNEQLGGRSAIWISYDVVPPKGSQIVFEGQRLETVVGPEVASAIVPDNLVATPGTKQVFIEHRSPGSRKASDVLTVIVKPRTSAVALADPVRGTPSEPSYKSASGNSSGLLDLGALEWGPHETLAGQGFNIQPDGRSAIWVSYETAPPSDARIVFDGRDLDTVTGPRSASAYVPDELFATPGDKIVYIIDMSGRRTPTLVVAVKADAADSAKSLRR